MKYPRTPHLPGSPGMTKDDKLISMEALAYLKGQEVVVTEKLDGENSTLLRHGSHARSLDSSHHESRSWLKRFAADFQFEIPDDYRICGENLYAKHSIFYDSLPSYFMVFSIWIEDFVLSWDDTKEWCDMLGLTLVPELYRGPWDDKKIAACMTGKSRFGAEQEGYVVRVASEFRLSTPTLQHVVKWVRKGHVQTDQHWMTSEIIPNKLMEVANEGR